jgi:hypothetical protein
MGMALLAATTAAIAPLCQLAFRVTALLIVYRLAIRAGDVNAVAKVVDMAVAMSGRSLVTRAGTALRARRVGGGNPRE